MEIAGPTCDSWCDRLHHLIQELQILERFAALADRDVGRVIEAYCAWEQHDQLLLSLLQYTISTLMLCKFMVCGCYGIKSTIIFMLI